MENTNIDRNRSSQFKRLGVRVMLLSSWFLLKSLVPNYLLPKLLPYGAAQYNTDHPTFSLVDVSIQNLSAGSPKIKKIYERRKNVEGKEEPPLLKGPETIIFDDEGNMYTFSEDGILLKLSNPTNDEGNDGIIHVDVNVITKLVARPLGGKFVPNTKIMYLAIPVLGLCRIDLSDLDTTTTSEGQRRTPSLEIVVSRFQLNDGTWSQLHFADDVDIGPKSGYVYFSDATDIPPARESITFNFDGFHASVLDLLRAKRNGRLLRYDPQTEKVDVLAKGIWFANGVTVDRDETFIMISETFMARTLKYNLIDGTLEVMTDDGLTGILDGADCSHSSLMCYAPIPSPAPFLFDVLYSKYMPRNFGAWIRTMLMMLPPSLSPKTVPYGGVVEIYPGGDADDNAHVTRLFQDPKGENICFITGVTEYGGKLYLGGYYNDYVGVIDLV